MARVGNKRKQANYIRSQSLRASIAGKLAPTLCERSTPVGASLPAIGLQHQKIIGHEMQKAPSQGQGFSACS